MTSAILTKAERDVVLRVLAPLADRIDSVGVFGSRATGKARPYSDIDLVVYGDLDLKSERQLWTSFDETNLPVSVDVVVYSRVKNELLRDHIDSVGVKVFTRKELEQARNKSV